MGLRILSVLLLVLASASAAALQTPKRVLLLHCCRISHRTVELHRSNLLEKLGAASVSGLLRLKLGSRA